MSSFTVARRWAALAIAAVAAQAALVSGRGIDPLRRILAAETARRGFPPVVHVATVLLAAAVLVWALRLWHGHRAVASPAIAGLLALPVLGVVIGFGPAQAASQIGLVLPVALGCALVTSVLAARTRLRMSGSAPRDPARELQTARAIVDEHGEDSLSPFILRPDKAFEFTAGGVLAYRVIGETAVVSGDPVAPEATAPDVLSQFLRTARAHGCRVVLYGASDRHLGRYRSLGLRTICVGEEAVVDPAAFTLEGRPVRKLRQSVNRIQRRGWRIDAVEGRRIDAALESEIDELEDDWRSGRRRLLGFAMGMGEFERGVGPRDLYLLARSPDGDLRAVMRFISHRGNLSLDTMRRVGETPNGLNEALVAHALEIARGRGVAEVSLNYAGLAHLVRHEPSGNAAAKALKGMTLRLLGHRFQMDRLVRFNAKFSPEWRPRYLVYESRAALPRSVFRVLQAEGYVPHRQRPPLPGPRPPRRGVRGLPAVQAPGDPGAS